MNLESLHQVVWDIPDFQSAMIASVGCCAVLDICNQIIIEFEKFSSPLNIIFFYDWNLNYEIM